MTIRAAHVQRDRLNCEGSRHRVPSPLRGRDREGVAAGSVPVTTPLPTPPPQGEQTEFAARSY